MNRYGCFAVLAYCLYLKCEKVKQLVLLGTVNKSPETVVILFP